jgi:molybdate transport system ATP-binding protein
VGAGKTTLLETLAGRLPLRQGQLVRQLGQATGTPAPMALLRFNEQPTETNLETYYYQQRYHASQTDGLISAEAFLQSQLAAPLGQQPAHGALLNRLGLTPLLPSPFIQLSNGQRRKLLIAKALLAKPSLLLLDNPYTGLDPATRADLNQLISQVATEQQVVMVSPPAEPLPACITHVLALRQGRVAGQFTRAEYLAQPIETAAPLPPRPAFAHAPAPQPAPEVVRLAGVSVRYPSGPPVLENLHWTVRQGEKWALTGANGSGKSTLLALLYADHPQAYSNPVYVFGQKRGPGQSIWDLKRHIGFVSPELHFYWPTPLTAQQVAATGFADQLRLPPIGTAQATTIQQLFDYFSLSPLIRRPFATLSTGEQRLVLLVRALVKRPRLLLLDEPFQGLDNDLTAQALALLATWLGPADTLVYVTHYPTEVPGWVTYQLALAQPKLT